MRGTRGIFVGDKKCTRNSVKEPEDKSPLGYICTERRTISNGSRINGNLRVEMGSKWLSAG
jgi:hypothetical protein